MLDVCLLGTGGMMPMPNRWLSAMLLRYQGRLMLIDCGEGAQIPLKQTEWGFRAIDDILFTHYHADHIAGLPGLLLSLGHAERDKPVRLIGPPGLRQIVAGLTVIVRHLPFELEYMELSYLEPNTFYFGDLRIYGVPADHTAPCLSYFMELDRARRFDAAQAETLAIPKKFWSMLQKGESVHHEGKLLTPDMVLGPQRRGIKLGYCVDTRPTAMLKDFAQECDLLICEGMYAEKYKAPKAVKHKHMLFSEAAQMASDCGVKELWLTHFSPSLDKPEKFLRTADKIFPNTVIGQDLMQTKLIFER